MNYITHVAIVYDNKTYSLPKPNRHHNVVRMIFQDNGIGVKGPDTQGFLDSSGKFLNRRDAMVLATSTGQLNRLPGDHVYQGPDLYSEDLW